ncbi:ATP-dependent DNA helicase PIF1 [Fusarium pseudoanthophilum]|uniref:ATP-dependent DNA helicase PIF1 n=1 Tax=Fusarium pseudoanthophilum TaxID=48495 RepID=A0A8H5Q827_9HYPO|nr:ATP-dependent DNA helicase PIF1 [Fusarium pseudoanthophilum]
MVEQIHGFQATALDSTGDLRATIIIDHNEHILRGSMSRVEIPWQAQMRFIKSHQNGLSREREKVILGLQNQLEGTTAADRVTNAQRVRQAQPARRSYHACRSEGPIPGY